MPSRSAGAGGMPVTQRAIQYPGADQQTHDAACPVENPQQRRHEMHEPAARLRLHGQRHGQRKQAGREYSAGAGDRAPGQGGLGGRVRGGRPDRVGGTRGLGGLR